MKMRVLKTKQLHKNGDKDCLTSVITTAEAAEIWGLTRNAVTDACRNGRLRGRQSGRTWLVTLEDLIAYKHGHYWPSRIPPELQPAFERALAAFNAGDSGQG